MYALTHSLPFDHILYHHYFMLHINAFKQKYIFNCFKFIYTIETHPNITNIILSLTNSNAYYYNEFLNALFV